MLRQQSTSAINNKLSRTDNFLDRMFAEVQIRLAKMIAQSVAHNIVSAEVNRFYALMTDDTIQTLKQFIIELNLLLRTIKKDDPLKGDLIKIHQDLRAAFTRLDILFQNELMIAVKECPEMVDAIIDTASVLDNDETLYKMLYLGSREGLALNIAARFNSNAVISILRAVTSIRDAQLRIGLIKHILSQPTNYCNFEYNALMDALVMQPRAVNIILQTAMSIKDELRRNKILCNMLSKITRAGWNALLIAARNNYKAVASILDAIRLIHEEHLRYGIFQPVLSLVGVLKDLSADHFTQLAYDFYHYYNEGHADENVREILSKLLNSISREKLLDNIVMSKSIQCAQKIELLEAILDEHNVLGARLRSTANADYKPEWYQKKQVEAILSKVNECLIQLRKFETASNLDDGFIIVESEQSDSDDEELKEHDQLDSDLEGFVLIEAGPSAPQACSSSSNTSELVTPIWVGCSTDGLQGLEGIGDFSLFAGFDINVHLPREQTSSQTAQEPVKFDPHLNLRDSC